MQITYTVEYYENTEGGMNSGCHSHVAHDNLNTAIRELEQAENEWQKPWYGHNSEGWIIVVRVNP